MLQSIKMLKNPWILAAVLAASAVIMYYFTHQDLMKQSTAAEKTSTAPPMLRLGSVFAIMFASVLLACHLSSNAINSVSQLPAISGTPTF